MDLRREATIPFTGGSVSVTVQILTEGDRERAERTLDCIFGLAVNEVNSKATRSVRAFGEVLGEDGDPSSGMRQFTLSLDGGASCSLLLSFEHEKSLVPEVVLGRIAHDVLPTVFAHAAEDLVTDDMRPAFEASGYEDRLNGILRERQERAVGDLVANLFGGDAV